MKSKQTTSLIVKAIMLLLALIVMVFVGSYTWYISSDTPATASGLSVSTKVTQEFKVAVGFNTRLSGNDDTYVRSEFSREFNLNNIEARNAAGDIATYNLFETFVAQDLTGDGITLVRPGLTARNIGIDREDPRFTYATPNEDYISFDLYIQSENESMIYLDNKTRAYGLIEKDNGELAPYSGSEIFSPDAVVGALRVSFCNYDEYETGYQEIELSAPNALWIPRSNIRFDDTSGTPVLYTNIDNELHPDAYYTIDGQEMNTYKHTYYCYTTDDNKVTSHGYAVANDAITTTISGLSKDNVAICEVTEPIEGDDGKTYYYGKVHVNIWIEGCDSEARRAMNTGKFFIEFDVISKDV